jgi:hypothetical protein
MHDIDCHIIIHNEPQWKIDRCMASFDGQAVNVHFVQGVDEYPPHKSRAVGFALGSAPYVTYADPDDWIDKDYFSRMSPHLGECEFLYGSEIIWRDGVEIGRNVGPHHAFVITRASNAAADIVSLQWRGLKTRYVPEAVYNWDVTGGRYGKLG